MSKSMQIILHIGMHKTGTTAIQTVIGSGQPGLGVLHMGRRHNQGRVFEKSFGNPRNEEAAAESEKMREEMARQIISCQEEKFLISGERISLAKRSALIKFRDFASQYCDDIRVIGYVRPPHGYMQSHFQQKLKGGLSGAYHSFDPDRWYGSYKEKFEHYDDIFGRSNVTLKLFDRRSLLREDIVEDFCAEIGVKAPSDRKAEVNTSLSLEAVSLLYVLRKFGPKIDFSSKRETRLEELVVAQLSKAGSTKFSVSSSLTRPVIQAHQDDIDWMENRLEKNLAENIRDSESSITSEDDLIGIAMELAPKVSGILSLDCEGPIGTPSELAAALAGLRLKIEEERKRKSENKNASEASLKALKSRSSQKSVVRRTQMIARRFIQAFTA